MRQGSPLLHYNRTAHTLNQPRTKRALKQEGGHNSRRTLCVLIVPFAKEVTSINIISLTHSQFFPTSDVAEIARNGKTNINMNAVYKNLGQQVGRISIQTEVQVPRVCPVQS